MEASNEVKNVRTSSQALNPQELGIVPPSMKKRNALSRATARSMRPDDIQHGARVLERIESSADFARAFSVSHETAEKLQLYANLLAQWQKAVNLIAPAALPQIWQRHFADSAQLLALAPAAKIWVDLGSGGGFPALVIAIMLANQKECCVHLIESNARKCAFLAEVARRTGAAARVHNARIADAASSGKVPAADAVTARALAPLDALLELALPFFGTASTGLFLKGREAGVEIADARKRWVFDLKIHPSISDAQGQVLEIGKPVLIRGGEQ
jgi:16S rRNA (guanine527-N7)-methyltransferase